MILTLVVFIFVLGLLIFVHELGHFLAAKRAGIKVEEFAFGFPPRLFAVKKGETEYALNLFPIGGYVKMLGETEDAAATEKKNPRSFAHQSVWVRTKVIVAGVSMNVILGWLLITVGFTLGMTPVASQPEQIPLAKIERFVVVAAVGKDTAADKMGLKPSDMVTRFNDKEIKTSKELSETTKGLAGQEVRIEIVRDGKSMTLNGTLGSGEAPLGVQLADDTKARLPFWWAPFYSVWETLKAAGLIFVGIIDFFKQLVLTQEVPAGAAGPVGIFYFTRSVLELGFTALLNFMAVLSINLAIINILPIPALDGGRLLFIALEKFNKGKKVVNATIENTAHTVGFVLLILLIIAITYNDILRLGK